MTDFRGSLMHGIDAPKRTLRAACEDYIKHAPTSAEWSRRFAIAQSVLFPDDILILREENVLRVDFANKGTR
jgi:hypothetical protein